MAKACQELGVKTVVIQADMTSTAEARRAVRDAVRELGGLDLVLANSVSVPPTSSRTILIGAVVGMDEVQ